MDQTSKKKVPKVGTLFRSVLLYGWLQPIVPHMDGGIEILKNVNSLKYKIQIFKEGDLWFVFSPYFTPVIKSVVHSFALA